MPGGEGKVVEGDETCVGGREKASVIGSNPAIDDHLKTGQRTEPGTSTV